MSKKYQNPPIIEAVCEFRFSLDTKWDLAIPGLLYEKVKADFPVREQRLFQEVEIKQSAQGVEQIMHPRERIVFLDNENRVLIQVGERLLAINCLKSYPTWTKFVSLIRYSFKAINEVVKLKQVQRIGLRYINRIEIADLNVKLDNYFDFRPSLGDRLPKNIGNFMIGCVIPFKDMTAECDLKLMRGVPQKNGNMAFILDIDYYLKQSKDAFIDDICDWIEKAHAQVENIFEGCITDRLRIIFKEYE